MVAHTDDLRAEVRKETEHYNESDLRHKMDNRDDAWVDRIGRDYKTCELSDQDRALCDHANALTRSPGRMSEDDVGRLRDAGLSDRAIHDATQVIAYFNYINRIADGLGVDLEEGMPEKGAC